jgi:hypothetical protein
MKNRKTIQRLIRWIFPMVVATHGVVVHAEDEVSLFDGSGKAQAYIALDDEMTIYTWSGKPVAYLEKGTGNDGYNVYGFNGKHLGWFTHGAIYGHDGKASCATAQVMASGTQGEPFKSFKQFKPFKAFTEYAPFQPFLATRFGDTPCNFLLSEGAK